SEFSGQSLVKELTFYQDWMLLTINSEYLLEKGEEGFIEQLRASLSINQLSISVYSEQGVSIKQFSDLTEFHKAIIGIQKIGGVIQDIYYALNYKNELTALNLTFYPGLKIDSPQAPYDSLIAFKKAMLEWIDIYMIDDEKLCQFEEGADLRLASYCRHKRIASGGRKLISELLHRHLFVNKVSEDSLRLQYLTMISGLMPNEKHLIQLYLKGDRGYFPKRMKNNATIKKIQKVISFLKKVYKFAGKIFPNATLQNAFDKVDDAVHRIPPVNIDTEVTTSKKPVRKP
ncbi:MAG: hypothetical protein OXE99_09490, partial [Cellvibrionales bacterium]|nr:hypothetical protein [Cellvibrionales bacterium]